MFRTHNVVVPVSLRFIATTIGSLAALNLIALLIMYLHQAGIVGSDRTVRFIMNQFNLGGENRVATWYSSMLLLLVSLGALGCFALELRQPLRGRERILSFGWVIIAVVFVGLSLDELGSIHERIPTLQGVYSPVAGLPGWVGFLAVPIAMVGLFVTAFAMLRVRLSPAAFYLMLMGLLLLLSVPVQEHLEVEAMMASNSPGGWRRPVGLALLEEGTEIFASLCFFASTLVYTRMLVRRSPDAAADRAADEHACIAVQPWMGVAAVALLLFGFIVVEFGLLRFTATRPNWGIPRNWFASTLAFGSALIAWELGRGVRRAPGLTSATGFLLLALLCLLVSADHGSAHAFTQQLWAGHPRRSFVVTAVYAAIVSFTAVSVARRPLPSGIRWLIGTWAVLLVAGILTRSVSNVPISFAAFTVLLPTLLYTLPVVARSQSGDGGSLRGPHVGFRPTRHQP